MNSNINEQELLKRLAQLPREREPEHDPWGEIAARLDEPGELPGKAAAAHQGRTSLWRWPLGAVAATAVLALAFTLIPGPQDMPGQPAVSSNAEPAAAATEMPILLAGSEAEYQAAFREFVSIGESRTHIPARTVEKIETGWADLRQVETALADALALNPDDPFLNRRMLDLRARQLGFLRQLAALDHSNRRLTI